MYKNHEGYHDPTACEAVRRVNRSKRNRNGVAKHDPILTYWMSEVPSFREVRKLLR